VALSGELRLPKKPLGLLPSGSSLVHLLSVGNEIFTAIEKYIPALLLIWAVIRTLIQFYYTLMSLSGDELTMHDTILYYVYW
jgi:hypothetical protein